MSKTIQELEKAVFDGIVECDGCGCRLELDTYVCGECGTRNEVADIFGL